MTNLLLIWLAICSAVCIWLAAHELVRVFSWRRARRDVDASAAHMAGVIRREQVATGAGK